MSYSKWKVARVGRKDGRSYRWVLWPFWREPKNPIPPDDDTQTSPFEQTLCQAAEKDMQVLAKQWQAEDQRLFSEYCKALHHAKTLEAHCKKEGDEAQQALDEYQTARHNFLALDPPSMERSTAWLILGVIAITELVFNAVVFEIFMRERWETYLMGLLPLLIPFLGDWVGATLRQETRPFKENLLIVVSCVVAFAGTLGIAWIRSSYLMANEIPQFLNIPLGPWTFSIIFVTFNILLFVGAIVIGYMSTPKDREAYAKALRDVKNAAKKLGKEGEEAEQCARELLRAQIRLNKAKVRREKRFRWYQERAKAIKEEHDVLVRVYQEENTRARGGRRPQAFANALLQPKIPDSLQKETLDWNCGVETLAVARGVPPQ